MSVNLIILKMNFSWPKSPLYKETFGKYLSSCIKCKLVIKKIMSKFEIFKLYFKYYFEYQNCLLIGPLFVTANILGGSKCT